MLKIFYISIEQKRKDKIIYPEKEFIVRAFGWSTAITEALRNWKIDFPDYKKGDYTEDLVIKVRMSKEVVCVETKDSKDFDYSLIKN